MKYWQDKPYNTLNAYCKEVFNQKIYKVSFDIGVTCPNRDGKIGTRGCIFCSEGGSGEFAKRIRESVNNVKEELDEHIKKLEKDKKYIGYFQAFTNTYGDKKYLKECYEAVLCNNAIIGISIGTRADCIDDEIIEILMDLKQKYNKFVWIELGFQTMHKKTIDYIRRGYDNHIFINGIKSLKEADVPVIVHLILGLPEETKEMMLDTIKYINDVMPFGVKLQLLHILSDTDLAIDYLQNKFQTLSQEDYIDIVVESIELLDPRIVIHRVTGDGDKTKLIAPTWSGNKKNVLNQLHKTMKERKAYQGKRLS